MSVKDAWGDDTLLSVAMRGDDDRWNWSSFVEVDTPDGPIPAIAQFWAERDEAFLQPLSMEQHTVLDKFGIGPFTLRSRPGTSAQWRATATATERVALPRGRKITIQQIEILSDGTNAEYYRIVYRGIKLPHYTNGLWLMQSATSRHRFGFTALKMFGRKMVLSEIAEYDDIAECYVGLTMQGGFLEQSQLDAVEMVLYLVAGVGGMRQCVETFDGNGKWRQTSFHRLGHAMESHAYPMFPTDSYADPAFYEKVAAMIERAQKLILQGFPLRAVLFHVFTSQRPIPEIAITHLGIALDGTQNAVVEKIKGEGKLMPQDVFNRRIAPVVAAAKAEFADVEDKDSLTLILRRITEANNWSLRERWKRFWRDYIKYALTDRERAVLEHRDAAIHAAYILRTEYDLKLQPSLEIDRRPYEERLAELEIEAKIFRNVMNRVILHLLEYQGEFVDSTNWRSRLTTGP